MNKNKVIEWPDVAEALNVDPEQVETVVQAIDPSCTVVTDGDLVRLQQVLNNRRSEKQSS